jgi:hypothetical protein
MDLHPDWVKIKNAFGVNLSIEVVIKYISFSMIKVEDKTL